MRIYRGGVLTRLFGRLTGLRKLRRLHFDSKSADELLLAQTDAARFVVSAGDTIIGRYCYVRRRPADFEKLTQVHRLLPDGHRKEILIDIGANIGTICIPAVATGLFQRAVAVEPEPGNYRLLATNVVLNGLDDRIQTHNRAMADVDGADLQFEMSTDNHGDHRVRTTDAPGLYDEEQRSVINVKSLTLDALDLPLQRDNALVWMDVQGYEGAVLAGAASCIDKGVPICMEFSPYALQRSGSFEKLNAALANAPYSNLVDLDEPSRVLGFELSTLQEIADKLGSTGGFTDLLIW